MTPRLVLSVNLNNLVHLPKSLTVLFSVHGKSLYQIACFFDLSSEHSLLSLLRRGSMGRYLYPLNEVSAGANAERVDFCQKHVVFLYILVVFLYIDRFLGHL